MVIVRAETIASMRDQLTEASRSDDLNAELNNRMNNANPAALDATDKNAVIGIGAPS